MDRTAGFRALGRVRLPSLLTAGWRLAAVRGRTIVFVVLATLAVLWGLAVPFAWTLPAGVDWTPYLWRVPLVSLAVILVPIWFGLQPLTAMVRELRTVETPLEPESDAGRSLGGFATRARETAATLTRWVPLLGVFGVLVGMRVGASPTLRDIAFGLGSGLFLAVVLYAVATCMLWPVVAFCNRLAPPMARGRTSVLAKALACMLIVSVDTALLQWVAGEPTPAVMVLPFIAAWALSWPLSNLLRQVQGGAAVYTDDEIGELSTVFDTSKTQVEELQRGLEKSRDELLRKVHQRTQGMKEQTALFEVSKAVTSTLHLDRVLEEIVTRTRDLMDADGCALWLRRLDKLELKASMGLDKSLQPPVVPMNTFSSGLTQFGRPHVLRLETAGQLSDPMRESLQRQQYRVLVAAPLASRGNTVGVLGVYYRCSELTPSLDLLATVGSQAAVAIENARLYEKQQYVTHLLRDSLSPREPLGFEGVEVGHRLHPSLELSGDYYDLIPIGPKRFDVVIADVAGKGPDAAIQTARAKNIIAAYATAGLRPGEVLSLLNRQMLAAPEAMHLVTVFYGQADLENHRFVYSCAGHEPALLWGPSTELRLLSGGGMIVGVSEDARYEETVVPLDPGTSLLLYTDGVTEARSPDGDFFSVDGLLKVVQDGSGLTPQELVSRIFVSVNRWSEGHITDDLSLLALRV